MIAKLRRYFIPASVSIALSVVLLGGIDRVQDIPSPGRTPAPVIVHETIRVVERAAPRIVTVHDRSTATATATVTHRPSRPRVTSTVTTTTTVTATPSCKAKVEDVCVIAGDHVTGLVPLGLLGFVALGFVLVRVGRRA
jgi:hypothetical protein